MVYKSLEEMINFIEYGTKLHIGVLFYGNHGNEMCNLSYNRIIHHSPLCNEFKSRKNGYTRCFACRNLALKKAISTKLGFGGLCINGIYEYTRPVIINEEIICIIYIGNILDNSNTKKLISKIPDNPDLINTLESGLLKSDIETICDLIEGHIVTLLEKYPNKPQSNLFVENIKNYIIENIEYDINLTLIADVFHYNKLYLGRLFKKETGVNITDYINEERLKLAAKLLKTTNQSITIISSQTGFNNVTYFNRLFKKRFGVSPKEYRTKKKT